MNIRQGKLVRSGGRQDGAATNWHGNQPQPLSHGRRCHGNPWDASRGSPHQVNNEGVGRGVGGGANKRSRDGRITCGRGGWEVWKDGGE